MTRAAARRYKILKNGTSGQRAYGPTTKCNILGEGWVSTDYPDGPPILWEKNRKKPLKVVAHAVMPCWEEAMNSMEIGAKWEIVCTPELGYKDKEKDGVPPHSVLIFRALPASETKEGAVLPSRPAKHAGIELLKCMATRDIPGRSDEL